MSAQKRNSEVYYNASKIKLVRGGTPFFETLLQIINTAKKTIHLQIYIYDEDETGTLIANALIEAVKRKVNVFLLADGYASRNLSRSFIRKLRDGGVHFRFFNPLFKSQYFYIGRRLHHKIAVIDSCKALAGGINISNNYNDMPGSPAWLDFAVYIEGEAARQLCMLCWKTWNNFIVPIGSMPCEHETYSGQSILPESRFVALLRNDWVRKKNQISATYVNMFRNAKSHITILCSYFLPGRVIRRQLAYAVERGVTVSVIVAGISDVSLAKYAERYMYPWLLSKKVRLYEYKSNVLHGKIAVCDNQWLTIGSYNINNISAYASIELNVNVRDEEFAIQTEMILQEIVRNDCIEITSESNMRNNKGVKRMLSWFSYSFIRAIFYLFTFYLKHQK